MDEHSDDPAKGAALAFLQHEAMEEVRDYLTRGRRFETLGVEEIKDLWVDAVRAYFGRLDGTRCQDYHDLSAELSLRRIDPPDELVEEVLAAFAEAVKKRYEQWQASGAAESGGELSDKIDSFLQEWAKPRN